MSIENFVGVNNRDSWFEDADRRRQVWIFAGKLPREYMSRLSDRNPNERKLLCDSLRELGARFTVAEKDFMKYEEVQDGSVDAAIKRKFKDLLKIGRAHV